LTRFRRRCRGKRRGDFPQCRELINRTRRNTGGESSSWRASGRSIKQLAREFEPTAETIRQWIKQAALDDGLRSDGLTTSEREELNRLRREIRVLREEREILAKAAAWFAQETGAMPKRRSNS
jgi:transposase